jgi:glycosyltransferase involved in cell wall biosynthesis
MRVALDTNALYTTQAGSARYVRGLLRGFAQEQPAGVEVTPLGWPVENFAFRQPERAFKTVYRELIWATLVAPALLAKRQVDLFHSTAGVLVRPPRGVAHVATLLDLAVVRTPQRFRRWHLWSARRSLRRLTQADRVICISEFTAKEAEQLLGLPRARMSVVYCGCEFHPDDGPVLEQVPDFPVPDEFFLFVGSLEPGKNLSLLKAVYQEAATRRAPLPPLLVVGVRWAGLGSEGKPPANWRYLGRQPDPVLVYLFRRAVALLFPSTYEGFGLPVVEAMALGCPVICSPVASLPEVGGEAALYADLTPSAYCEAAGRLVREAGLREELIQRGYEQAKRFSWRRCAQETLAVYRQAPAASFEMPTRIPRVR